MCVLPSYAKINRLIYTLWYLLYFACSNFAENHNVPLSSKRFQIYMARVFANNGLFKVLSVVIVVLPAYLFL